VSRAVKLAAEMTADLRPSCRIVAMIIAAHLDRHGEAWPSVRTIAAMGGLDPLTVTRAVDQLESLGLAKVTRQDGKSNRYRLALETPPLSLVDYPQPRDPESRGTEHMSARLPRDPGSRGARDPGSRGRTSKDVEEAVQPYPCWCDDCVAAVEARTR
jgi:DNA-binding transcriptional ArsR family regulator